MLDINFIRENKELVKKTISDKGMIFDVDKLIAVANIRRDLLQQVEDLNRQKNEAAKNVHGTPSDRDIEKGKRVKEELDKKADSLRIVEEEFSNLMLYVPNIPSDDSPVGPNSDSNKEISKWGEIPKFNFKVKDHIEIGKTLDIIDLEAGVKVAGLRGYYLKNEGAKLHWAVLQYALEKITQAGFTQMIPPTLVHKKALIGSGHIPFAGDNTYKVADTEPSIFLAGTSEPSLLAYYQETTVSEDALPIKVCALTHCYRSEVGDYGKDTKGLFRVHEFDKVEQVIICKDDLQESEDYFKQMQQISESILQEFGIPYHVVATSTGDMGAGKYRMNDIESWMPGREKYRETHSNSNLTDWQARRLNLKYKTKDGNTAYCYTLNNTVIASPRILISLLENFQQQDGSVKIPEVLQKYTGFSEIKPK